MGLGGQLGVVRSVSRVAGSDDLGAVRLGFLLWFADAMAKEPLSTYSFPLFIAFHFLVNIVWGAIIGSVLK
jgi:hypothetical protein